MPRSEPQPTGSAVRVGGHAAYRRPGGGSTYLGRVVAVGARCGEVDIEGLPQDFPLDRLFPCAPRYPLRW